MSSMSSPPIAKCHFVIAGAQRCGTTYLYKLLDQHPKIEMARPIWPEPKFFLDPHRTSLGLPAYDALFEHRPGSIVRGEKSTTYIESDDAARRMVDLLPGVRVVVLVRDPVARAISNFRFSVDNGVENLRLREALTEGAQSRPHDPKQISASPYAYLNRGKYADYLDRQIPIIGRSNLRVIVLEELLSDDHVLEELCAFLDLEPFEPEGRTSIVNASLSKTDELTPEHELHLREYFEPSIQRLEDILERPIAVWPRARNVPYREQKKLMILGAGQYQLPAIRRARELGCRVITVDYLPDNIGHRFADASVNANTTDQEAVLTAAQRHAVNGIATFASDVAAPTVAAVARAMHLPGTSVTAAKTLSDKGLFRRFQHNNDLNSPAFAIVQDNGELSEGLARLRLPLMVKPVDASGSRGITMLASKDLATAQTAFARAHTASRAGRVCIEEFVTGIEVGGDAFMQNGELVIGIVTEKRTNDFVVVGHCLPTNITPRQQAEVLGEVERVCQMLGHLNGPVNFDVVVDDRGATILEMSARTGGNGIPQLIARSTGFDPIEATIKISLGQEISIPTFSNPRPCGSLVFGSAAGGVLVNMAQEAELRQLPYVFDYFCAYEVGQHVPAFEHGSAALGHVLFDLTDKDDYDRIIEAVTAILAINVRPNGDALSDERTQLGVESH